MYVARMLVTIVAEALDKIASTTAPGDIGDAHRSEHLGGKTHRRIALFVLAGMFLCEFRIGRKLGSDVGFVLGRQFGFGQRFDFLFVHLVLLQELILENRIESFPMGDLRKLSNVES